MDREIHDCLLSGNILKFICPLKNPIFLYYDPKGMSVLFQYIYNPICSCDEYIETSHNFLFLSLLSAPLERKTCPCECCLRQWHGCSRAAWPSDFWGCPLWKKNIYLSSIVMLNDAINMIKEQTKGKVIVFNSLFLFKGKDY